MEKKIKCVIEGEFYLKASWWSKTKVFGSIIEGKPFLYFTEAEKLKGQQNEVVPVYDATEMPRSGWQQIDLQQVTLTAPIEDEDLIKIRYPNQQKKVTFSFRNSCMRNLWFT